MRKRERERNEEREKEILVIVSMTFGLANFNTIVVDKLFLNKFTALEFGQKKRKKIDDGEKGRGREKLQRERERGIRRGRETELNEMIDYSSFPLFYFGHGFFFFFDPYSESSEA